MSVGFKLPDGSTLEGEGVTPDIPVDEDWLDFPEEDDPGILAALELLASIEPPVVAEASVPPGEGSPAPGVSLSPDASAAPAGSPAVDASSAAGPHADADADADPDADARSGCESRA